MRLLLRVIGSLVLLPTICFLLIWISEIPNKPVYEGTSVVRAKSSSPYEFGVVEFSEHGNLFSRDEFERLLGEIEELQRLSPTAIVVFVHGWHHNARSANVDSFKRLLEQVSSRDDGPFKDKRVVGLYIGWRGELSELPGLTYATFWDRKSVAQEIAKGGVTEVLLRLERLNRCGSQLRTCDEKQHVRNRFRILGHSFGGAIVFSSLSEVFAERIINAQVLEEAECEDGLGDSNGEYSQKRGAPCVKADRFAHAVVLLNPAIEANQALQLKEIISERRFPDAQDVLMHILSSEGDMATRLAFRAGQIFRNLSWSQAEISNSYKYAREKDKQIVHDESELSSTTIGNYAPFRTGWIGASPSDFKRCWSRTERPECKSVAEAKRIPSGANEPIQFFLTDSEFMKDHNDVFNCKVRSYILAIAQESVSTAEGERFSFGRHYRDYFDQCPD